MMSLAPLAPFFGKGMRKETLTGNYRDHIKDAYALFLSPHEFQWFCTFTFKDETHPEHARKAFGVFISKLNSDLYGRRWRNRAPQGVVWVNALEYQKRGVIHFHTLIAGVPESLTLMKALAYQTLWRVEMGEGFARIDLIDEQQAAVKNYVCKYVTKGGELEFSENFEYNLSNAHPHRDLVG